MELGTLKTAPMKVFEVRAFGIDQLAQAERETPRPRSREVLVRLKAASLNYRDLMVVEGRYNPNLKRPMVPLSDGMGVVEEVGPEVTRFQKGDRVAACFMQSWIDGPPKHEHGASALGGSVDGVLREYAVFSEEGLVRVPDSLTDEEAATLPCAAVTAWNALFESVPPVPGETVLLQGTGGVSIFALQFAKAAGLKTILTSSSEEKIKRARQLGADFTIDYQQTPNWEEEVRKLTDGRGVDRIIEVGGSGTLQRSLKAIRTYGLISVIGVLSGGMEPAISPASVLMNSVRLYGIYVGSRAMFERMLRAIEQHRIKPVIDRVFPWTSIRDALHYMKSQQHFGKICLTF
jgi:NADPH:quinone reductase-like Zn-dependent oxidoreductase